MSEKMGRRKELTRALESELQHPGPGRRHGNAAVTSFTQQPKSEPSLLIFASAYRKGQSVRTLFCVRINYSDSLFKVFPSSHRC